jgi:ubiquinone/menaquinone biosynthesis C-methylase UbiE
MDQTESKKIASQLSHPQGEDGVKVAENMHVNNGPMIQRSIELLGCKDGDVILEIGPGNGGYVPYVLSQAAGLQYYGIDISTTMIAEAEKGNAREIAAGRVHFNLGNGMELPYEDQFFDKVFTVNTLYFWKEPLQLLDVIRRVLKPGGRLSIGIRSRAFMEQLPFTEYGFRMYELQEATALLEKGGFRIVETVQEKEGIMSWLGKEIEKDRIVIVAERPA